MDFIFMTKKISNMFITGPDVIKAVTGEKIDFEGLGGTLTHNEKSGVLGFFQADFRPIIQDNGIFLRQFQNYFL